MCTTPTSVTSVLLSSYVSMGKGTRDYDGGKVKDKVGVERKEINKKLMQVALMNSDSHLSFLRFKVWIVNGSPKIHELNAHSLQ